MNSDFRVSVDFFAHHKTKKLKKRLGYEGVVALLQLWAYAARLRPDGDLSGMEEEDIELAADWCGEEGTLVPTLKSVGFLDEDEGGLRLHDWQENNAWAAAGESRSDASRLSRMAKVFPDEYQALVSAGVKGVSKKDYEAIRTSSNRQSIVQGIVNGYQVGVNDTLTTVERPLTNTQRPLTTVERPFDDDLSPAPAPSPAPMAINNTPLTPHGGDAFGDAGGCLAAVQPDGGKPRAQRKRFVPPTVEEVADYCRERQNGIDPEAFVDFYTAKGWLVGKSPMKDWRSAVRTWEHDRRSQTRQTYQMPIN